MSEVFTATSEKQNKLYPLFLNLKGKKVLIVGGGLIALQKVHGFLNTDAELEVLAPHICDEIRACRGEFPHIRKITFTEREYEYGDEVGAFIVIAATDIAELNTQISNRCRDQMIMVNSVDKPQECDFYVPSIIDAQDIKIGISSNGKAPAISQRIRKDLQKIIENKYLKCMERVVEFRHKVKEKWLGENQFARRSKIIRWYTDRLFKGLEESEK